MTEKLKALWEIDLENLAEEVHKALRRAAAEVSSGNAKGLYILVVAEDGAKLVLDAADLTDRGRLADTVLTLQLMAESVEGMWRPLAAQSLENSTDAPMAPVRAPEPEDS